MNEGLGRVIALVDGDGGGHGIGFLWIWLGPGGDGEFGGDGGQAGI
jgi:hypothetical protein